jgi:hypothetical protein
MYADKIHVPAHDVGYYVRKFNFRVIFIMYVSVSYCHNIVDELESLQNSLYRLSLMYCMAALS